jgi:tetratricopeptide (TPR) repeat protein
MFFVGHDLGTWIIKQALADFDSVDLVARITAGVAFCDIPQTADDAAYDGILKSRAKLLRTVDQEFEKLLGNTRSWRNGPQWVFSLPFRKANDINVCLPAPPRFFFILMTTANQSGQLYKFKHPLRVLYTLNRIVNPSTTDTPKHPLLGIVDKAIDAYDQASAYSDLADSEFQPLEIGPYVYYDRNKLQEIRTLRLKEIPPQTEATTPVDSGTADVNFNGLPDDKRDRLQQIPVLDQPSRPETHHGLHHGHTEVAKENGLHIDEEVKADIFNLRKLAHGYHRSGDLDNTETLYQRSRMILKDYSGLEYFVLSSRVRMEEGSVIMQKGRYVEAEKSFSDLRAEIKEQMNSDNTTLMGGVRNKLAGILKELLCWIAMVHLRQGHYSDAMSDLKHSESIILTRSEALVAHIKVWIRRLTALIHAHLGRYRYALDEVTQARKLVQEFAPGKPAQNPSPSANNSEERFYVQKTEWFALLQLTETTINVLSGEFRKALETSTDTLESMRKAYGPVNVNTLEALSLHVLLLAYNYKEKAEPVCKEAIRTMMKHLGREHPVTLDTINSLVYVLRVRGRFREAFQTAKGACKQTEVALGHKHLQTLSSRRHLALLQLAIGDYWDAECSLASICNDTAPQSDIILFMAQVLSTKALAQYHSGKLKAAIYSINDALSCYDKIENGYYGQGIRGLVGHRAATMDPIRESDETASPAQPGVQDSYRQRIKVILDDIGSGLETFWVHPDRLFFLEVLAKIEAKTADGDKKLVKDIYQITKDRREKELGKMHPETLKAHSSLALAYWDLNDLAKAEDHLSQVYARRREVLGASRPDTLATQAELYQIRITIETGRAPERTRKTIDGLEIINHSQTTQLGRYHPDTIRTLFALLLVQLYAKDQASSTTSCNLLERLREPSVRKQRFAESLEIEERVALVHQMVEDYSESSQIFDNILESIRVFIEHELTDVDSASELEVPKEAASEVCALDLMKFKNRVRESKKYVEKQQKDKSQLAQ